MPTIKDKINFNLDGVDSSTYGLLHVNLDSGMLDDIFVASRSINETQVRGNRKTILHGVEEEPLEFEMTIAFETGFTDASIDAIVRWLFVGYYRPLYFEGAEDRIFNALIIGSPRIIHTGTKKGYFTVTVRCDSSYMYSPIITTTLETVVGSKTITINSTSHFDVYPEISIVKNGAGIIVIESLDDDNNIFEIRNLTNAEDIYVNAEKEIIETDVPGVYRYDDVIGEYPRLVYGQNRLLITGDCTIQLRYKETYMF